MSIEDDVRRGVTQANWNAENRSGVLYAEIFIISLAIGLYNWSSFWLYFGVIFFGLLIAMSYKPIAIIFSVALSAGWAAIVFGILSLFSTGAAIFFGILIFLGVLFMHMADVDYAEDLGRKD